MAKQTLIIVFPNKCNTFFSLILLFFSTAHNSERLQSKIADYYNMTLKVLL